MGERQTAVLEQNKQLAQDKAAVELTGIATGVLMLFSVTVPPIWLGAALARTLGVTNVNHPDLLVPASIFGMAVCAFGIPYIYSLYKKRNMGDLLAAAAILVGINGFLLPLFGQ